MPRDIKRYNGWLQQYSKKLRRNMTKAECLLWIEIKSRKIEGVRFSRQIMVGRYIVDFYCKELKIAIEVDGPTHTSQKEIEADQTRQEYLENEGILVLRFSNEEVKFHRVHVVHQLTRYVKSSKANQI